MTARPGFLNIAVLLVSVGIACSASAQVYQVGGDNAKSPQAPAGHSSSAQPEAGQSLGWGSNIQNARLARAAQLAIQRGDKAQAVDFAQRAAQSAPSDPQLWFLLGYAARIAGRFQLSLDAYNRGLRVAPGSLDGQSGLAQDYALMGRTDEAEALLKKIIAANPRRRNDVLLLGETYMRQRNYNDALTSLNLAERLSPDARSELLLALSYQQLKQMDKASHYLNLAKHRAPDNPDVQRSLAGYYRATGDYSQAITALTSIHNPAPDVVAELAYTYQLNGKLDDSARLYSQAANQQPKDIGLQLSAAQAEVAAGSLSDADFFLKRAESIDPNSYRLHAVRGQIAQTQDRTQDAVKEYQTAIAHLPPTPAEGPLYGIQLHMDLLALHHSLGEDDAAQHELAIAQSQINSVDSSVNHDQFLRLRALIKLNAGDTDGALADIKDALASNPSDRTNLQLNGDILMKLGRTEDAIDVYKRVLKQDANNRFALTSMGYAERAAGRDQEAEKYFLKLQQADPKLYVSYLALGDLYTARKQYSKAEAVYEKGHELAPKNALIIAGGINAGVEAHELKVAGEWVARLTPEMEHEPQVLRERERYLSFKGQYQDSANIGEQAIKVLSHDRDVVVYLGYDYLYLQKYTELFALTSKYMNVLPKEPDIPLLAGYVHKHNGESEQAEQAFSEAIKRDPKVETAYVNRGYMLNDLHEPQGAEADFETALKMDPDDGQAHLGLAYSSLDLHKDSIALKQADLAQKLMGDNRDVHVIRATAYGSSGLLSKAATEYRAALTFTPNDGSLRLGLGNALLSLRHYHEAITELDQAARYLPNDPDPYALLSRCYGNLQDQPQTVRYAMLAEQHAQFSPGPVRSRIFIETGEAFSDLGDQNAAMGRFSKALNIKGSDRVAVRLAIAQLMAEGSQTDGAERQIALALMEAEAGETVPPTGTQYIAAADVFRALHDYELSQSYLERAKGAGAPDASVRIGMADNYLALGYTSKAQAELDAVSTSANGEPTYQYLMAEANVYRQDHEIPQALTSFAQAANAAGDDQSAEKNLLQAGGDEGLRLNPAVSLASNYSLGPIYEDTTIYVLDSKLDAAFPVPPSDTSLLPPPRSSIENQWTNAFHLHFPYVPTPSGFFQVRNAQGDISAPSPDCGASPAPINGTRAPVGLICTQIIDRDTTDYNANIGLNPILHFGRNLVAFNGGVQGTIRRDSLQPVQMNQNLLRLFLYGSTNSLFNAVSISGYVIRESGPFTESNQYSRALTGAVNFSIGTPWGKTALVTGWGASDQLYTPQTYEAYVTSSYFGFERRFGERFFARALIEDIRAWRIVGANSGIAQNLRPAGTIEYSPTRNWEVELNSAYSSNRGFHIYDATQNGISVSYAMPFHRKFADASGPVMLAYPIRFIGGIQNMNFFNFPGGQQQLRPYIQISIF